MPDVFSYGAVEQNGVLGHDCNMLTEGLLCDALQVLAINLYASSRGIKIPSSKRAELKRMLNPDLTSQVLPLVNAFQLAVGALEATSLAFALCLVIGDNRRHTCLSTVDEGGSACNGFELL